MKRKSIRKTALFLGTTLVLSSCTYTYTKAIDLETANKLVAAALAEQMDYKVESVAYSLKSEIKEYILDENNQEKVIKKSSLEVTYKAPYLISDETTVYALHYKSTIDYVLNDDLDNRKEVRVSEYVNPNDRTQRHFVVTENGHSHDYAPTTDSAIASFINLPTLINANNIASLTLCQSYMGSIGKYNNLTSFEALSSGGDNFTISFEGESISVNDLYAEETSLTTGITINSFSLSSTNKDVDYYESDYQYSAAIPELELDEAEIFGNIHVSYSYK